MKVFMLREDKDPHGASKELLRQLRKFPVKLQIYLLGKDEYEYYERHSRGSCDAGEKYKKVPEKSGRDQGGV